jgi:hypothetical protein
MFVHQHLLLFQAMASGHSSLMLLEIVWTCLAGSTHKQSCMLAEGHISISSNERIHGRSLNLQSVCSSTWLLATAFRDLRSSYGAFIGFWLAAGSQLPDLEVHT